MAIVEDTSGFLNKIKWTWTCAADGTFTSATTNRYNGICHKLVTIPAAAGNAPTTLYDITITDADGVDVLQGNGADRSATLNEYKSFSDGLGDVKSSVLTLNITNAGNAKQGTVVLYLIDVDER